MSKTAKGKRKKISSNKSEEDNRPSQKKTRQERQHRTTKQTSSNSLPSKSHTKKPKKLRSVGSSSDSCTKKTSDGSPSGNHIKKSNKSPDNYAEKSIKQSGSHTKKPKKSLINNSSSDCTKKPKKLRIDCSSDGHIKKSTDGSLSENLFTDDEDVTACETDSSIDNGNGSTCETDGSESHFACERCGARFTTNGNYKQHLNKTYPCIRGKAHGNNRQKKQPKKVVPKTNPKIVPVYKRDHNGKIMCEICCDKNGDNITFPSVSNYNKHMGTKKHKKNVTMCELGINIVGNGNNTKNVQNSYNRTINNYVIYNTTNEVTLLNLDNTVFDITKLTHFEQYCIFVCNYEHETPYTNLLYILNFKRTSNNYYTALTANKSCPNVPKILDMVMAHCHNLLCTIFNRFRVFLSRSSTIMANKHIYDGLTKSDNYNANKDSVYKYILDNKTKPRNLLARKKRDKPIWNLLSTYFCWKEVITYLDRLIKLRVDFDKPNDTIRWAIEKYIRKNDPDDEKKYRIFFKKIMTRFHFLQVRLMRFDMGNLRPDANSSGDEMAQYFDNNITMVKKRKTRIKIDDHVLNEPRNSCYGGFKTGNKFPRNGYDDSNFSLTDDSDYDPHSGIGPF